ncbi:hypothetical protein MRX96_005905 [Rhipicephalus microplus]
MQTLAIVPSLKIEADHFLKLVSSNLSYHVAVYWVLVQDDAVLKDEMALFAKISPAAKVSIIGRCNRGVGSALIYSDRSRNPVPFGASELLDRGSLVDLFWRPGQKEFTRESLVVVCLHFVVNGNSSGHGIARRLSLCNERRFIYLRRFLKHKNVSLVYTHHVSVKSATTFLVGGKADIFPSRTHLGDEIVDAFSFADTDIHYDTFYALANDTTSVSMFTVLSHSTWGLALTLLSMLTCTLFSASLNSAGIPKAFLQSVARESLFLMASILATSTPEPWHRQHPWTRRLIYVSWMAAILSLSVYIRSQMTALVTATKPANHLDTLDELEDAVDAGRVAPVVAESTWNHANLKGGADHPYSLLRKLSAVYKQHQGEQLVVPTPTHCILAAGRRDRVCYLYVLPRCTVQKFAAGIQPFEQPMTTVPYGIPVRHGFAYLPALRKLFFAVREGSLIRDENFSCETHFRASNEHRAELREFVKHYVFLQLVAVVVFAAECLIGLFLKVR